MAAAAQKAAAAGASAHAELAEVAQQREEMRRYFDEVREASAHKGSYGDGDGGGEGDGDGEGVEIVYTLGGMRLPTMPSWMRANGPS